MKSNEEVISTERLFLKGILMEDAGRMFQYRSDPDIYKFENWKPRTLEEVKEFIQNKLAAEPDIPDSWYLMGIFIKGKNELAGDIGINFNSDGCQAEVKFTLSIEHQGKGYGTEAVFGIMNYLFYDLQKHRITASVDPRNVKSIALLKRVGMRKEAHFKKSVWFNEEWADNIIYAILREEWIK